MRYLKEYREEPYKELEYSKYLTILDTHKLTSFTTNEIVNLLESLNTKLDQIVLYDNNGWKSKSIESSCSLQIMPLIRLMFIMKLNDEWYITCINESEGDIL